MWTRWSGQVSAASSERSARARCHSDAVTHLISPPLLPPLSLPAATFSSQVLERGVEQSRRPVMRQTEEGGRPPLHLPTPPLPRSQQRVFSSAPRQTHRTAAAFTASHCHWKHKHPGWRDGGGTEKQQTKEPRGAQFTDKVIAETREGGWGVVTAGRRR